MTPERYQLIGQLFDEALELAPEQRAEWLAQVCSDDTGLLDDVEKLLASHSDSKEFLSRPALDVAAELLAKNHAPFAPDKQVSHYKIISLLGVGGMGEVYLAQDTRLKRKVALKVLPQTIVIEVDRLRRFEQEAFAASALNHPNILTIHEFGVEGETHFIASEFIQGETLRARLQRNRLALSEMLDLTLQIASALQAAHAAGIVHRDIKPENIMVRPDEIVKVLDFGLAKLTEDPASGSDKKSQPVTRESTKAGAVLGTTTYMSPEQARGLKVDARTDIFSLGVVLYEMVAGRAPFEGPSANDVIAAILTQEVPPLSLYSPAVPTELVRITSKALEKDREDRYQGVKDLLLDVKRLKQRLEFEAELHRSSSQHGNEAQTQILQNESREFVAETAGRATTARPTRSARLWTAFALAFAIILGVAVWQGLRPGPALTSSQVTTALPERNLSYSLTVQKYRDGKPYQSEFQSSGREIFEPGWKFKLNLASPQEGFLYLLNQEPGGNYVLLFPLPSHNNGSAHIEANERLQTNWYVFDDEPGTEQFRLVWAAQSVPDLERFRELVNPTIKGRISDPAQTRVVSEFLNQHAASQLESVQDQQNRETRVSGRGSVLVTLVELEHH